LAPAAEKGAKTLAEPAVHFDVKANIMMAWWDRLLEGAADVFGEGKPAAPSVDVKERRARIGGVDSQE
jgi:transposase-like protein